MLNIIKTWITEFIIAGLSIVILKVYFDIFFVKNNYKIKTVIVYGIYFIWQLSSLEYTLKPVSLNIIANMFVVSLICIYLYNGKWLQQVFFSVLIVSIWSLMEFIVGYLFVLCDIDYKIPVLLGAFLSKLLVVLFLNALRIFFQNESIKYLAVGNNLILLLISLGSMYVIYNIFTLGIDQDEKTYIIKSLISLLIMFIINVMAYKLYLILAKEKELQKVNAVYVQQIELCNTHNKEKELAMLEFRKARHDIKQHDSVILKMLENKQYNAALDYLRNLTVKDIYNESKISRTDNIVIDSLINAKYVLALDQEIKVEYNIHIPAELPFQNADLSIVIGNLFDNALEASALVEKEQRFIGLYIKYEKPTLIMVISNTYTGNIIRNKYGKILTSKIDSNNHGFGLESVRKTVEKYNGTVIVEEKDRKFWVKVVMIGLEEKLH